MGKKSHFIVILLLLVLKGNAVIVETTANLNVYYPEYSKIDLVCGQMPKAAQKDVEFCCEAAFTGELLDEFKHSNIADNHICNGKMIKGYSCKANTGRIMGTVLRIMGTVLRIMGTVLLIYF